MSSEEKDPRITVYVGSRCHFCRMAEALLKAREIPFRVEDADDPIIRQALVNRSGWKTIPVIFLDGQLLGGYQELAMADRSGDLGRWLAASPGDRAEQEK